MTELWTATYIVLWVVVAIQTVLILGALRQLGIIQLRLGSEQGVLLTAEGLPRGAVAPDFAAEDALAGVVRRLAEFRGRRLVLSFLSPTCQSCKELIPDLNAVGRQYADEARFLVVCRGTTVACAEFARFYEIEAPVLSDLTGAIATSFGVHGSPFTFLLDEVGRVRIRGIARNWMQLEALLREEGTLDKDLPGVPFTPRPTPSADTGDQSRTVAAEPVEI